MGEGVVVTATLADSVRVELGGGRSVQVPAAALAAVDRLLTFCRERDEKLVVEQDDTPEGDSLWFADVACGSEFGGATGTGRTPWAALADLADRLGGGR